MEGSSDGPANLNPTVGDDFDVENYLKLVDPEASYSIESLHGGVVNFTWRATKMGDQIHRGSFAGHRSLILKHAPPYVALRGEEAPFDQYRQVTSLWKSSDDCKMYI